MLEDFDKQISIWAESFARKFNRRKMVGTTVKGVFATIAAASIGQVANIGQAFAVTCACDDNWTTGQKCGVLGYGGCSNNVNTTFGCPGNCSVCKNGDCGGWCNWSSGHWVSCTGCCASGKGYRLCWDCKCPDCKHKCSCLSACIGC